MNDYQNFTIVSGSNNDTVNKTYVNYYKNGEYWVNLYHINESCCIVEKSGSSDLNEIHYEF